MTMSNVNIVIGASSGYGKGIADVLEKSGRGVIRLSRSMVSGAGKVQLDVRDAAQVSNFFEGLGGYRVESVIYCAGLARGLSTIEEGLPWDWHKVFETNTFGLMYCLKGATSHLRRSRGSFITLGSIASQLAYEGGADYCGSKAAVRTIMQTYRSEIAGSGIRMSLIEPGAGDTNFHLARYDGDLNKAQKHYGDIQQLKPEDLGNTVLWILGQPWYVNIDELVIKPLEQVTHGKLRPIAR